MSFGVRPWTVLLCGALAACTSDDAVGNSPRLFDARADAAGDTARPDATPGTGRRDGSSDAGDNPRDAAADRTPRSSGGAAGGAGTEAGRAGAPIDGGPPLEGGENGGSGAREGGTLDAPSGDAAVPDGSTDAGRVGGVVRAVTCAGDGECAPGSICAVGACTPGDCAIDSSCPTGKICGLIARYHCAACATDADCRNDSTYGASTLCVSGSCRTGDCHVDADCPAAGICGLAVPNACARCAADADCTAASYGAGDACISGSCVRASCASDADCAPGQICGSSSPGVCAPCSADADCRNDAAYGASTVCVQGRCVTGNCHGDADCAFGQICGATSPSACAPCTTSAGCRADTSYGLGTVCANGACTPGDCVTSADCAENRICGVANPYYCGDCVTDTDCREDPAYGAVSVCVVGACLVGNCERDRDCPAGRICGAAVPNTCGTCTSDTACRNDPTYGAGFICDSKTGSCVSGSCDADGTACPADAADICCGSTCVPGDCCSDSDCTLAGSAGSCVNHVCTACPAAPGGPYTVDPVDGTDATGTGDGAVPRCAFRTITRALAVIAQSAGGAAAILVLPKSELDAATGEIFPIVVPENVTISGSSGNAHVVVGDRKIGFVLGHPNSGLSGLLIDGHGGAALSGVVAGTGTTASTTIANVVVTGFSSDGIRVEGAGALTIGDGVSSVGNGTTSASAGLRVVGQARVTADVPMGTGVHFDANSGFGIRIEGTASVAFAGTPGSGAAGTLTANANDVDGLSVNQTPGSSAPPENSISGLVSIGNGGNGAAISAGSRVVLRGSRLLGNRSNGVLVATYVNGAVRYGNTSLVDLGTAAAPDYGENVLQASPGENPNLGAGICLAVDRTLGQILNAAGNAFAGGIDCSAGPAVLNRSDACANGADISVTGGRPTSNSIAVSACQ